MRARAGYLTQRAIRRGELKPPTSCEGCKRHFDDGIHQREAHHPDYRKPLEVEWLCIQCHNYVHSDRGWEERTA